MFAFGLEMGIIPAGLRSAEVAASRLCLLCNFREPAGRRRRPLGAAAGPSDRLILSFQH